MYKGWVEVALAERGQRPQQRWSESIAVGSEAFVRDTKERLGIKAVGREVMGKEGFYELRESEVSYGANFGRENRDLRQENAFSWDEPT
jgi:putative transposase